ncbi:MAG: capsular biosynthesis protein [Euryarchaeota archaeon]|nr:capsular biosynthesis protein [Euryarchaeota archaeon]
MSRNIQFSPPDITQAEIDEVVDTLRSGWITTGPKTKQFEREITTYCGSSRTACLNSATAGMELILRMFDIGPGDEVITSAYTYTSTASVIVHCGATPILVDIKPDDFNIHPARIEDAITERTKAIIPVDIAGMPADYDEILDIVHRHRHLFSPVSGTLQESFGRIVVIADGAHSLGARYHDRMSGDVADFTVFSFHAVKNLTTAEGGAVTWRQTPVMDDDEIYRRLMLLSLHGQTKDALAKTQSGSWEYDIAIPGWKHNMADLNAAIGLAQLRRYDDEILSGRKEIARRYHAALVENDRFNVPLLRTQDKETSYHLYLLRIEGYGVKERDNLIRVLAERGIPTNVHYKPLPMFTAYAGLGYLPEDHPVAMSAFASEITLPLHNLLNDDDVEYITTSLIDEVCG